MILEITFGFFIIVESYIIWNLMRKTELLETWIENFTDTIQSVNDKIIEIDGKGYFESDDEVGFFFTELKELNSILNNIFDTEVDDANKEEEKKEK